MIAHATFLTEGVAAHANVVFPALAYPEKEGTVVHPDGRLAAAATRGGAPGRYALGDGACWTTWPRWSSSR